MISFPTSRICKANPYEINLITFRYQINTSKFALRILKNNFFILSIFLMGIRGLFPYLKSHPRADAFMETIPFLKGPDEFLFTQNKKVIVDTPSIFQVHSLAQCFEKEPIMANRFPNALSLSFVLDGTRHPLKKIKTVDITNSMIVECTRPSKIQFWRCMPNQNTLVSSTIFKAPYEGESLAAGLASCDSGQSVVVSSDSDAIVLVSSLENVSVLVPWTRDRKGPVLWHPYLVKKELGLDSRQFVQACLLSGTDFIPPVMTISKAIDFVKHFDHGKDKRGILHAASPGHFHSKLYQWQIRTATHMLDPLQHIP